MEGWWAGQRPLRHWSPSLKPCPQLCLPPPPFWSAARLMLAGGTPNPDTPPLLLGSQRYLEQRGEETKGEKSTVTSPHSCPSHLPSWGSHGICHIELRLSVATERLRTMSYCPLPFQHLAQCPDHRSHSLFMFSF